MSMVNTPTRRFPNNAALAKGLRVVFSAGYLVAAGATEVELGTIAETVLAADENATVLLRTAQGTSHFVAAGAIAAGDPFYAAASGKVAASGTVRCGVALVASTASNDLIEGLRGPNTDISTLNTQTLSAAADNGAGST